MLLIPGMGADNSAPQAGWGRPSQAGCRQAAGAPLNPEAASGPSPSGSTPASLGLSFPIL